MGSAETPPGVTGDASRDGVEPSRVVVGSFFGKERMVPGAHSSLRTPVHVYFSGEQSFSVHFGAMSAEFAVWTDIRGLDAIIDACLAAKVRAEVSGAVLRPEPPPLVSALDATEVPW